MFSKPCLKLIAILPDGNNEKKIFRKVLNKAELTEIVLSYWNYITDVR